LPEAVRLLAVFQEEAVLAHTGGTKIVGHGTETQDQVIVAYPSSDQSGVTRLT
jgi:hypothetical protein